jgi:hypothetical protein
LAALLVVDLTLVVKETGDGKPLPRQRQAEEHIETRAELLLRHVTEACTVMRP